MIEANTLKKIREEGRIEGKIEGEVETSRKISQNLLSTGLSVNTIATSAGLSIVEIKRLQNFLKK